MLKISIASAIAAVVAGKTDFPSSCTSDRCLPEAVSSKVAKADDVSEPAIGLMQTNLHYKLREQKVPDVAHAHSRIVFEHEKVDRPVVHNQSHLVPLHANFSACLLSDDSYRNIPFSTAGIVQNEAFQELGLIRPPRPCGWGQLAVLSSFFSLSGDVEVQNKIAKQVIVGWLVVSVGLMIWSVWVVVRVPKKKDFDSVKGGLADEDKAYARGFWNWVSLAWVDELIGRYGKRLSSVIDDNEVVCNRNDSHYEPYINFRKNWQEEVKAKGSVEKASLIRPLYKTVGLKATVCVISCVVLEELCSSILMVFALDRFLSTLENIDAQQKLHPGEPINYLEPTLQVVFLLWGVPMVFRISSIVVSLLDGVYTNICAAGLASIVFEKALNAPAGSAMSQVQQGSMAPDDEAPDPQGKDKPNIVQILNVDIVEAWGNLIRDMIYTIISPITIIALLAILVKQVKMAGLVGSVYLIPCLAVIFILAFWAYSWWTRYQAFQDQRLKWLTEAMLHIRTIKALAWEKLSFEKLNAAREAELKCQQKGAIIGGGVAAVAHTLPWGVLLLTVWYTLGSSGSIAPHRIIILQRIISSILNSVGQFVAGVHRMTMLPNSFNRIRRFLAQADRPQDVIRQPAIANPNAPMVRVLGSFTFNEEQPPVLQNLDVAIPKGELVAVVGGVASGKSTFLHAVIGELYPVGEDSFVEAPNTSSGHVAYCAQVPWIFEGTVRENIVLNKGVDQDRYYKSIYAAGLTPDFQILPGGDQVTIGSYGVRLSGGQRARVALARAAYMDKAELVLVDDPFASVDVPTGLHILNELLCGPIMRNRTRIVVTQPNPNILRRFDRVLLLEGGKVVEMGPPAEVVETKAFKSLQSDMTSNDSTLVEEQSVPANRSSGGDGGTAAMMARKAGETATALRDEETQDHITWSTMVWWFQAAGVLNLLLFIGTVAIQRTIELRENLVIAVWIDTKLVDPLVDDKIFMMRTFVVVLAAVVCTWLSMYAASVVSITSSRKIHHTIMSSLLRAPVDRFFDKQPVGRLINRLSYDMRQVDDAVVQVLFAMLSFIIGFIVTQTYILRVMPWQVVLAVLPSYAIAVYFIYLYRGTAVPLVFHSKFSLSNLQDLQAVVLGTCVSIRANNMLDSVMTRYNHYSQSTIRCQYLIYHVCRAWAQSRVFICFGFLTGAFALGGLWSGMPMGTLSICISFSFSQMVEFETLSIGFTMLLNILNALQRLTKYFHVEKEAEADMPGDPVVRKRLKIERSELLSLHLKRGAVAKDLGIKAKRDGEKQDSSLLVCIKGERPVLTATADGLSLELVEGCRLADLAPGCEALAKLKEDYNIIAINSVARSAELMAQELCNPPSVLWLDLWSSEFSEGMRIQIEDLTAGYGNAKSVLHSINVEIEPRMKCGFAGKTGCGKSTTLLCMLRLLEPRMGRILLGGRDSSKMGLSALRNIVGLVPQDPTVFEGTWRFNIDPFGEFPDARIWEALQCVQLMPYLRTLPDGIDSELARDGGNLSFGQRQLLSLARMVVRQPPILLLDECTSALDPNTQECVQKTLLNGFPMTTVVAIAHRIETIMDFDQIVVLSEGKVAEKGTVKEVCNIEDGIFAKMVQASRGVAKKG